MPEGQVLQVLGPSTGGIRAHVEALCTGLIDHGWGVEVASPERAAGPRHVDVPVPAGLNVVELARGARRLDAMAKRFDLVHAHGLKAGWTAAVARTRPWVLTVHNTVLPGQGGVLEPLLRQLEHRLPGRADAVIATSSQLAAVLVPLVAPDRLHVIAPVGPPPCPRRSVDEVRRELRVADGAALVVGVGRLHPQKGWLVLFDALDRLRPDPAALRVAVAGEGPMERELRDRLAALGLDEVVALVGPRADAADLLAAADVVVVPSVWESGPLVLAEAMTLGRPVIATTVGFAPDLVDDGVTGRLVAVGDAAGLAAALAAMLADPAGAARMAAAGVRRVQAVLGRDRLVDEVAAVYEQVLRRS